MKRDRKEYICKRFESRITQIYSLSRYETEPYNGIKTCGSLADFILDPRVFICQN